MKLEEMCFSVVVVEGSCWSEESFTMSYDNLNWNEAFELMRLSLSRGYEVVIQKISNK